MICHCGFVEPMLAMRHIERLGIDTRRPHMSQYDRVLSEAEVDAVELGASNLFFIGTVEYWDDARKLRQTSFCRRIVFTQVFGHGRSEGRFEKDEDPDYEYQD
jgi:hypothetical protein